MKPEKAAPENDTVPGQMVAQPGLIGKRVRVIGLKAKPEYIVMENLNIQGMMKNRHLSKAIQEQCLLEIAKYQND